MSIEQFLDRCTSCGACANECMLLKVSGTPDAIISRGDQDVFLCTNCSACTVACPSGCDPAEALLQSKNILLKTGRVSERVSKDVRTARRFAQWGHSFPFSHHSRTETVFWPGCSLAGTAPDLVLKTRTLLSRQLGKSVGLALDCCFNPAYQLGDVETVNAAVIDIEQTFKRNKITRVITACSNCLKIFRRYLPRVKVDHVVEILPEAAGPSLKGTSFYLHHPCATYHFDFIQKQAKRHLERHGAVVQEQTNSQCCGLGGNRSSLSQEQAAVFNGETRDAAGVSPIITYCMGCKMQFLMQGKQARHLLELFVDAKTPDRPLSSMRKWSNRFLLMLKARLREAGNRERACSSE